MLVASILSISMFNYLLGSKHKSRKYVQEQSVLFPDKKHTVTPIPTLSQTQSGPLEFDSRTAVCSGDSTTYGISESNHIICVFENNDVVQPNV